MTRIQLTPPDWWPSALGGKISYAFFWLLTIGLGLVAHHLDLFGMRERHRAGDESDQVDWERKSASLVSKTDLTSVAFWVSLSFFAMLLPAIACFSKLKRDKRNTYPNSVPVIAKTHVHLAKSLSIWLT